MITTIIILVCFGVAMLALEVILPGGIMGFGGVLALVAAIIVTFVTDELDSHPFGTRIAIAAGIGGLTLGILIVWLKHFDRLPFIRKHILDTDIPKLDHPEDPNELLDKVGVAKTDLRPAGTGVFDRKKMEVFAESGMIRHGSDIVIVKVDGFRIVVREVETAPVDIPAAESA